MKKLIIAALSLSIVFGFLFWKFGPSFNENNQSSGPVELTYWGLWEEESLIKPLTDLYQQNNPNVKINYVKQSSINYRTRVQTQIREGVGPDIFRIHNSWLPMFEGDLASAPSDVIGVPEYKNAFYPIASENFIKNNQIYAIPAEIDGLALYYNEDLLTGAGVSVPRNWQELIDAAVKLTVRDQSGQIKTAGVALGSTGNIDHWSDILGLLFLQQPGVNMQSLASSEAAEVLSFYTGSITDPKRKTWDVTMPNSTQAFAQGRLAFYFAPSWRAHELRQINPNLKFNTAPVPQLSGRQVGWGTFWAEAVSANSKYSREAWKFAKFLASAEAQRLAYQQASQVRLFGEPYSLAALGPEISGAPIEGSFVIQGPYYKSWYLSSNTFDSGINDEMIKYFEDAVNATLQGTDPQVALQTVAKGVQQVLDKYTKPAPAPSP